MFYKKINLIKINILLKNKIIKIKLNKNELCLIKIFLKLNIINNIKYVKNNFYLINLNINNNYKNIYNLYKPSKLTYIKLKDIININKKKTQIFFLSTNKGLLNNFEAEKNKIGGILLMKI